MGIKKHRPGEIEAMYFDKLPQRCKEMIFEYLSCEFPYALDSDKAFYFDVCSMYNEDCKSPIEHMFYLAFDIMCFVNHFDLLTYIVLYAQQDVYRNTKHYIADFVFDTDNIGVEDIYDKINPFKLVIECDGHEFHEKTKAQVKKDNERDYDLKMAGYDVLHFSGSQIYNEPFRCANEALEYIVSKIQK